MDGSHMIKIISRATKTHEPQNEMLCGCALFIKVLLESDKHITDSINCAKQFLGIIQRKIF